MLAAEMRGERAGGFMLAFRRVSETDGKRLQWAVQFPANESTDH